MREQEHPSLRKMSALAGFWALGRGSLCWIAVVGVLFIYASPCPAVALIGDGQESKELDEVRQKVRDLEERLRGLEAKTSDLSHQRETLEAQLELAVLRFRQAQAERNKAEKEADAASIAAAVAKSKVDAAIDRLRVQIGLLAGVGRSGLAPLVAHAIGSDQDLELRVTVTLALVEEQKRQREEASRVLQQRNATLAELSQRRDALAGAERQVAQRQNELEETRRRVIGQLASLERERRSGATALVEAREAEQRLERLWGIVARDEAQPSSDVRLLRGGLLWPVQNSKVMEAYGQRRDPQYGTVTVSHGMILGAEPNTSVTTIAAGKIVYAQFFKGYGNLVIVNHGNEVYSLYGNLASMLVRPGQRVGIGEPIGQVARDEGGSGRMYLEIRVGQKPVDPRGWLKPLGR